MKSGFWCLLDCINYLFSVVALNILRASIRIEPTSHLLWKKLGFSGFGGVSRAYWHVIGWREGKTFPWRGRHCPIIWGPWWRKQTEEGGILAFSLSSAAGITFTHDTGCQNARFSDCWTLIFATCVHGGDSQAFICGLRVITLALRPLDLKSAT